MTYRNKHWSASVNQAVVQRAKNGSFNLCIEGGSEYGQFVVIGDVLSDKILYRSGTLAPGEIILEINGKHIAGYTQTDSITLIKDSNDLLYITSVYPGIGITRDLRKYLATRFPRGSLDHELQQTIRDNLYLRTVPCTTRKPRDGEVPGVDYEFLTVNEYLELERSGKLLESGYYESNYYGTPKPPKTPMTPGTGTIRRPKLNRKDSKPRDEEPLPNNWEIAYTKDGEMYFVDHNTGRTQWDDPRKKKTTSTSRLNHLEEKEELPPGWEKVNDPKYGTYYIDHVNRRTQYEKPVVHKPQSRKNSHSSRIFNRTEPEPRDQEKRLTIDARKLQGETFRVNLRKGAKGFGFTIVGGEQPGECLQVNNIVRGGAADMDGRLRTGDLVMRLNGRNVLSWSHGDIIRFLQQTRVGEFVELDVVRGYPLPFDPNDPTVKRVSYTMINGPDRNDNLRVDNMRRSVSDASLTSAGQEQYKMERNPFVRGIQNGLRGSKSSGYLSEGGETYNRRMSERQQTENRAGATTPVAFRSGQPQYIVVSVVRGPNGFGFTIADSPYGQRVKEIIDRDRCQGLYQGDVLIRINDYVVHNLDHTEVVEVLKKCRRGEPTNFQVQRSGQLTVVKSMPQTPSALKRQIPRPKSMPAFDDDQPVIPGVRSSTSMGVIATTGESSTVNTTTYEGRNHPQVNSAGDGYKSLKRAVQSNSRDVDSQRESGSGFTDHVITLKRGEKGFGFKIVGGQEENTQVAIDVIVPNGAADQDGRLCQNDIILAVDGINVVDATHKRVISLIRNAGLNKQVTLRIRRKTQASLPNENGYSDHNGLPNHQNNSAFRVVNDRTENLDKVDSNLRKSDSGSIHSDKHVAEWIEDQRRPRDFQPYQSSNKNELSIRPKSCPPPVKPKPLVETNKRTLEILLTRNVNEGFGFVIMSHPSSNGSVIGRIIADSPSERSGRLKKDDRLLEVNGKDVSQLSHSEIVSMVKNSGLEVRLRIETDRMDDEPEEEAANEPPPRPAEPTNYRPTNYSYNRHTDNLKENYMKQQKPLGKYQWEANQPARPKSAPMPPHEANGDIHRVAVSSMDQNRYTGNSMTHEERKYIQESAKRKIETGEPTEVLLYKGERGFGFSIRGGEGMPLFVLRIAEGGPAWEDGRIKVGDEILEINGKNAEVMSHAEAVNTIRNCAQTANLLIRRPLQPIVSEGHSTNGYVQPNDFERPRSGYY